MSGMNFTPDLLQSDANVMYDAIQQILINQVNTIITGTIELVNDDGTYDIQPTLNYLMKDAPPVKPPLLPSIPQVKMIFGSAEIKGRFKKGDAVLLGIVQRDITVVKKNWKKQTNPNSLRRFSLPDGIILSGLSNNEPTTFIEIKDDEVFIKSKDVKIECTNANIKSKDVKIECTNANIKSTDIKLDGSNVNIDGTLKINGEAYNDHKHKAGSYNAPNGPVTGESGAKS